MRRPFGAALLLTETVNRHIENLRQWQLTGGSSFPEIGGREVDGHQPITIGTFRRRLTLLAFGL